MIPDRWDVVRWLMCRLMRHHFPITEHRAVPWPNGKGFDWPPTGWTVCAVCRRRLEQVRPPKPPREHLR